MSLRDTLTRGFRFSGTGGLGPGGMVGSGWGNWFGFGRYLPGAEYDYQRAAGDLWSNNIVMACLKWQGRVMPDALQTVTRKNAEGKREVVPNHPGLALMEDPSPCYDTTVLQAGINLSLMVDGNAYLVKVRSALGKLVGFIYVPHFQMEPWWPEDGSAYIGGYVYRIDGKFFLLDINDVVHLKDGIDPRNPRKGLSALGAVLREICTDNEAATFAAAILRNMGIPGVIISPKQTGTPVRPMTTEKIEEFKQRFSTTLRGDNRGEPFVNGIPIDISMPGFSPSEMDIGSLRDIPEERVTAVVGIPALVVGMGAGLDKATYANAESLESWAWRHNVVPTLRIQDMQMTRQVMNEVLGARPGDMFGRDYSGVQAMSEDLNKVWERAISGYKNGLIMRSTGLRLIGEEASAADDLYFTDLQAEPAGDNSANETELAKALAAFLAEKGVTAPTRNA